jgi:hypothetical protein
MPRRVWPVRTGYTLTALAVMAGVNRAWVRSGSHLVPAEGIMSPRHRQMPRCRSHPRPVLIAPPSGVDPSSPGGDRTVVRCRSQLARCRSSYHAVSIALSRDADRIVARHGLHDGSAWIARWPDLDRTMARHRSHPGLASIAPECGLNRMRLGVDRTGIRWGSQAGTSRSDVGTHQRLHRRSSIQRGSGVHCGRMSVASTVTPSIPLRVRSPGTAAPAWNLNTSRLTWHIRGPVGSREPVSSKS